MYYNTTIYKYFPSRLVRDPVYMPLFKWPGEFIIYFYFRHRLGFSPLSPVPERHSVNHIWPSITNEIYIFDFVAPPTGRLTPGELGTFSANLSLVSRFVVNFCLPHTYMKLWSFVALSSATIYSAHQGRWLHCLQGFARDYVVHTGFFFVPEGYSFPYVGDGAGCFHRHFAIRYQHDRSLRQL